MAGSLHKGGSCPTGQGLKVDNHPEDFRKRDCRVLTAHSTALLLRGWHLGQKQLWRQGHPKSQAPESVWTHILPLLGTQP